jgi:hypothetical protein
MPNIEAAAKAMDAFDSLKKNMLKEKQDYVQIGGKLAITRAGFSKIALAFGLSNKVLETRRVKTDTDYIVHVRASAVAPNGRFSEASASCSTSEFQGSGITGTIANVEAKAQTRATSRAIANLVGGGVLSTEELPDSETEQKIPLVTPKQLSYIESLVKNIPERMAYRDTWLKEHNYTALDEITKHDATDLIDGLKAVAQEQASQ